LSMRLRFILSHVLPLLIVIPLVGMLLIVSFERQVIVPGARSEVEDELDLLQELIAGTPGIWDHPAAAQGLVDAFYDDQDCCLRLMDADGRLIASNNPADAERYGSFTDGAALERAMAGEEIILIRNSQGLASEAIEGWAPLFGTNGELVGVLQVSHPLSTLAQDIMRMRGMVLGILGGGLAIGLILGLTLSLGLERPLRRLTCAVDEMRSGETVSSVAVSGPPELRELTRSFNELVSALQQEKLAREQLIANLVHELGRPMGAMRSAVLALSQGADQDPELKASLLAGIDAQTRELERLVNDLMHLHEYASGRFKVDRQRIGLRVWLTDVLSPWRSLAEEKGIEWSQVVQDLPAAWIDPERMSQALGNVLSNALKFTPNGGQVRVRAGVEAEEVVITVEDTGPGLSEDDLDNLFTPFYVGRSVHRFPQGMGLGLNIARGLVVAHYGTIEARALPGQGSQFTVRLPISGNHAP
jgi:two-component system sensor histidine kinase BaeS